MRTALLLLATAMLACTTPAAEGQALFASNTPDRPAPIAPLTETPTIVLAGRITNPDGPLPGAVVTLTATKQMAVTNADGEFQFVVPATSRSLQAVVTYAGYADETLTLNADDAESTATLANARVVVVSRRQQLKHYLKTARKEAQHDLREVHKNSR
jgi:hypothetical protein